MAIIKKKRFLSNYSFGVIRVFADIEQDAERIYQNVVEANPDTDVQTPESTVSREEFDAATVAFYKERDNRDIEYDENYDSMFTYDEVEVADSPTDEIVEEDKQDALNDVVNNGQENEGIVADIQKGDEDSTIMNKYRAEDFVDAANQLGVDNTGTKQDVLERIKLSITN